MGTRTVTLTGRVTDKAGNYATKTTTLTVNTPSVPLGWCPVNSNPTDLADMLARYPNPKLVRYYKDPGAGLPSWSEVSQVPATTPIWFSFKDWDPVTSPQKVRDFYAARPTARKNAGTVDRLTIDHEPEQDPGAGDPLPADFQREWQELGAAVRGHARRSEIKLVPVFTEYYARRNATTWWTSYGIVASYADVDEIGFDVYDTGYPSYRTVTERNDFMLSQARRAEVKKPLSIAEWGIKRKPSTSSGADYDLTGSLAAQAMRDQMAYLRTQPDVGVVAWFYRGFLRLHLQQTYDTGPHTGETYMPDAEKQAFIDMMAVA